MQIVLTYLSIHSIPVIGLHFLSFKIVNLIYINLKKLPTYMLASFPVVMVDGAWWILYMAAGILIPLSVKQLYIKTKCSIKACLLHVKRTRQIK